MHKSIFALALFGLSSICFAAQAADLGPAPVYRTEYQQMVQRHNWTGFYVGVSAGWARGSSDAVFDDEIGLGASAAASGMLFGPQMGYNWQSGNIVAGVETDISWSNMHASGNQAFDFGFGLTGTSTYDVRMSGLYTFRGRVGYLPIPDMLLYATGGIAATNVKMSCGVAIGAFSLATCDNSKRMLGWTAGAGVEYALNRNWTAKLEYLYANFGTYDFDVNTIVGTFPGSADLHANIVRAGLNYRF